MLLDIALDKPEHLSRLPRIRNIADIVEIGTPLLSKSRDRSDRDCALTMPGEDAASADTKTVDGGQLEAEMVFGAGAAFMTVLSSTSKATHEAVIRVAADFGGFRHHRHHHRVRQKGTPAFERLLSRELRLCRPPSSDRRPQRGRSVDGSHRRRRGHASSRLSVALAGGIGPDTIDAVLAVEPEIQIIGSAITGSEHPKETARWIRGKSTNPGHGWPWDKK